MVPLQTDLDIMYAEIIRAQSDVKPKPLSNVENLDERKYIEGLKIKSIASPEDLKKLEELFHVMKNAIYEYDSFRNYLVNKSDSLDIMSTTDYMSRLMRIKDA